MAKNTGPRAPWLPEQDELLTKVWNDAAPLKTQLHLFPGRSWDSIQSRGAELQLPDRRLLNRVRAVETTGKRIREVIQKQAGTIAELAARAGVSRKTINRFIEANRADLHIRKYAPWNGGGPRAPVFAWGKRKDATKPARESPNAIANRYYRKRRKDPEFMARNAARLRLKYAEKTGKLVRRDLAAVALFGATATAEAST